MADRRNIMNPDILICPTKCRVKENTSYDRSDTYNCKVSYPRIHLLWSVPGMKGGSEVAQVSLLQV